MSDGWRERNAERALKSDNQCVKCGHMVTGKCSKWNYSKTYATGEWNMAPWCQFYTSNPDIDKNTVCPCCQRPY